MTSFWASSHAFVCVTYHTRPLVVQSASSSVCRTTTNAPSDSAQGNAKMFVAVAASRSTSNTRARASSSLMAVFRRGSPSDGVTIESSPALAVWISPDVAFRISPALAF